MWSAAHCKDVRRPWCSAWYNQHPLCVAKNIADFYPNFTSERWTLMEPPRLEMFWPGKASSDVHGSIEVG